VRGSARIYVVRVVQFVLKIEKLSHIISARGSQDLRSPFLVMAPDGAKQLPKNSVDSSRHYELWTNFKLRNVKKALDKNINH